MSELNGGRRQKSARASGADVGDGDREHGRVFEVGEAKWLEVAFRALGPLRPFQMQRFERARELVEVLGRTSVQHALWLDVARRAEDANGGGEVVEFDAVSAALESFDPERGASGRPGSLGEYTPGTTRTVSGSRKLLGGWSSGKPLGVWVRLDHAVLELGDSRKTKVYRLPIATPGARTRGRRASKDVAELVWFEAVVPLSAQSTRAFRERALLLLDDRGYCLAIVENIPFRPNEVLQFAQAADVPAAAYRVRCLDGQVDEIQDLMFPRRARVKKV
jgi:hypothetical protein